MAKTQVSGVFVLKCTPRFWSQKHTQAPDKVSFPFQVISLAPQDIHTDTAYECEGRQVSQSVPYVSGVPTFTTTTYDGLGRVIGKQYRSDSSCPSVPATDNVKYSYDGISREDTFSGTTLDNQNWTANYPAQVSVSYIPHILEVDFLNKSVY
jgi:hypothetical protein